MKQCANPKCSQTKNLTDFPKRKKSLDGYSPWCKLCHNKKNKSYYEKNKEDIVAKRPKPSAEDKTRIADRKRRHRIKNLGKISARDANYYQEHREEKALYNNHYRCQNKDAIKAQKECHRKANPGKINAWNSKRKALKLQATPKWLTKEQLEQIEAFYIEAARLTKETGIKYHVDHILPLLGKNIRGLHVPWNLQILTAEENLKKGNKI